MEDARATTSDNASLRPYSTPTMASRFPSLRRLNSSEPYRHRSLPAEGTSPGSDRASSEITFAVLYDDGPSYHIGHFDDQNSIRSGRPGSAASYAPSFRTRDSRVTSDEHVLNTNPDFIANQRLLAEGYLNANDSNNPFSDPSHQLQNQHQPRYPTHSEETLAMREMGSAEDGRKNLSARTGMGERSVSKHSHESWCTCEEDHAPRDVKDPARFNMDLEAQNGPPTPTPFLSDKKAADAHIVKFNGPNDPLNPKNWTSRKRWAATAVMASFTFVSPLASSMVAPALKQIQHDLHITSELEGQIVLSIFVLAYAVGPMVLGPLSELYGRTKILQSANLVFLGFNLACGFAQTKQQLMAFRFLSGLGGSAPLAIGGGVLGDLFKPEERGKAMGLYAMGPLLGPALGPIVGGWVAEKSTWRWMFWATTIVDFLILIAGFIWQPESYTPYILHKKAKQLRKSTGNPLWRAEGETDLETPVWKKILSTMARSFKMLWTEPIVQVMALYMAFSYGILYLMLSTYSPLFITVYHESVGVSGLNYISLGLGFFVGAPICGKTNDKIYHKLKAKDPRGKGKPEFRMPLIVPFSFLVPIGLLTYGWSAQYKTHWIVPNVGAFIMGIGTIAAFQCVTTYLVDSYARFAASAVAAVTVLRSLAGFGFPLFAPAMYAALDYGWGNTLLAIAAIGIGLPVPILLWIFGEKLRKKSKLTMKGPPPGMGGPGGPGGPGGKMGPGAFGPPAGGPPAGGPPSGMAGPPPGYGGPPPGFQGR